MTMQCFKLTIVYIIEAANEEEALRHWASPKFWPHPEIADFLQFQSLEMMPTDKHHWLQELKEKLKHKAVGDPPAAPISRALYACCSTFVPHQSIVRFGLLPSDLNALDPGGGVFAYFVLWQVHNRL